MYTRLSSMFIYYAFLRISIQWYVNTSNLIFWCKLIFSARTIVVQTWQRQTIQKQWLCPPCKLYVHLYFLSAFFFRFTLIVGFSSVWLCGVHDNHGVFAWFFNICMKTIQKQKRISLFIKSKLLFIHTWPVWWTLLSRSLILLLL